MRFRTTIRALATAAFFAGMAAPVALVPAQAADAERGRVIAERWCASCHLVSPQQEKAMDGVPSFQEIAERGALGGETLQAFLMSPHPAMPDMALTRGEIEDLARYIDGLAQ